MTLSSRRALVQVGKAADIGVLFVMLRAAYIIVGDAAHGHLLISLGIRRPIQSFILTLAIAMAWHISSARARLSWSHRLVLLYQEATEMFRGATPSTVFVFAQSLRSTPRWGYHLQCLVDDRRCDKEATQAYQEKLCGIRIDALGYRELIDILAGAQSSGNGRTLVFNHNLHSLYLHCTSSSFRKAYEKAAWVYVDGMPVVWLARLAGLEVDGNHRITLLDSFESILEEAEQRRWRVYYLGSREETLRNGLQKLRSRFPALEIDGRHGYFEEGTTDIPEAITVINRFRPHLLFVGMSMPTQEDFLSKHLLELEFGAALTSGSTLDYVAGTAYKPPPWAGPLGLYGLMRLCSEPRRLWRRYLWEPVVLLRLLGPSLLRQRFRRL